MTPQATSARLDGWFHALADPTRRAIVKRLAEGEATVSELAQPHDIGLPAVSKHIRVLEEAGIVHRWRDRRVHRCRLDPDGLRAAEGWLTRTRQDWERRLDRLEGMLREEDEEKKRGDERGHRARGRDRSKP